MTGHPFALSLNDIFPRFIETGLKPTKRDVKLRLKRELDRHKK